MSSMKIDVQWSPVDDDLFITSGSAITLYQVVKNAPTREPNPDRRRGPSTDPSIVTLDSKPQQQMKHVAWYPKTDRRNVFAIAQANGRITITGLGNANNDLIGKEFNVRIGQRSSNYIAWSTLESNYLAQGFEKNRNDPCIVIWDVTRDSNMEMSDRSRHSFSEGPIVKPYLEMGSGEGSSSFCWFPNQASTFVTGNSNKHLRIYDLRDPTKYKREAHHRCVSGICFDPLDNYRMASYCENQVAVWDLRSFVSPTNVITEHKNVTKMCWCPTNLGMLAVLTKDSSHVKLHDIRHSLFGSDDIEQVSIERKIQPFKSTMSSFAWHPKQENRLMTVMPNGQLKNMVFFDRLPVKCSSNHKIAMRPDKSVVSCAECCKEDDITLTMKERLSLNYGQDATNVHVSMRAVEKEPHLHGLWKWIYNVRSLQPGLEARSKRKLSPADMGVMSVLNLDKMEGRRSTAVPTHWKTCQGVKYGRRTMYESEERSLALRICRWKPDQSTGSLEGFGHSSNGIERSAAMDIFYLAIDSALSTLSETSESALNSPGDRTSLQAVAMALSGYTEEKDTLWQKTCGNLRTQMDNPYLRAIFTFLACGEDNYEDVLKNESLTEESNDSLGHSDTTMSVADRVEYALNYLSDAKLKVYLTNLVEELTEKGDLDGILLTGMTQRGVDLLQRYVNFTLDLQTAAIAAAFSSSLSVMKDPRVNEWVDGYRDMLDRWKLWHQRAVFDNIRQSLVPDSRMTPQILVSCNFCGKSISSMSSNSLMNKFRTISSALRGPQHRPKITCCPSCRKALPRCAICLTHMGTLSGVMADSKDSKSKSCPFDEWFTWCQTCRHGGHAGHMTQWFGEHMECPVTGCPCHCMSLDAVSHSMKPVPLVSVNGKGDDTCKG